MIMAQDMIGVEKKLCALPKEKKMKERKNHTEDLVGCICVNCMYNSVTTLFNRKKKYVTTLHLFSFSLETYPFRSLEIHRPFLFSHK